MTDEHVGLAHEVEHDGEAFRVLEVDADAALAPVGLEEVGRLWRESAPVGLPQLAAVVG